MNFKKCLCLIISLLMLLPSAVFADGSEQSAEASVSIYDAQMNKINGKIDRGETFYVRANAPQTANFSVYCAVLDGKDIIKVFRGVSNGGEATAQCQIPQSAADGYRIEVFVWEEESITPLNTKIAFNAYSPYETQYFEDGLCTGRELLKDASFESDNTVIDGWDSRNKSRISRNSKYVSEGSYSCLVSKRGSCWDGICQNITDVLKENGSGDYAVKYSVYPTAKRTFQLCIYADDNLGVRTSASNLNGGDALRLQMAEPNEWHTLQQRIVFSVPAKMHTAKLYVETTGDGANEDFYIDNCSLKKVITHEQYLRDNVPPDWSDSGMEDYLAVINAYKASLVSVRPQSSDKVLLNPYKGLNYYTTKLDLSKLDFTKPGIQNAKVVYHRLSWKQLEPVEGKYEFDVIKNNIKTLAQHGKMLGIGIGSCITYNGFNNKNNAQNTPDWFFKNYKAAYTEQIVGNGTAANSNVFSKADGTQYLKVPVYNDPIFKEKMQKFLSAFAEEFNGDPNIAFVDMRVYGNWGEWHFSNFNDIIKNHSYVENGTVKTYTKEDAEALVDMFKDFKLPLAMFTAITEPLTYAVEKYGAGVRVDGTLSPDISDEHRKMSFTDGKSFAIAEWFYQPEVFYDGGKFESDGAHMPVFLEKVIKEGRASYSPLGYWNPEDFYTRYPDLIARVANKTGYWFKPTEIMYPQKLTDGTFAMTVKNDGSTQLYAGYKRNPCVKLALADGSGNIIDTVTLGGVNPESWKSGRYSYITAPYSFANTDGAQKLYVGVLSDADRTAPDIKLGIADEPINGWYDVTAMTTAVHKSDNRLYTASLAYADDNYGYREPYHAFDGNEDTFWASEVRKGEYLEIDFGGYENARQIVINCANAVSAPCSVIGFNGQKWITLVQINGAAQGENTVNLTGADNICKIRLVFAQTSAEVMKVTEMYVD